MHKLYWLIKAYCGHWIPVKKSLPNPNHFDWVLVSFVLKDGFRCLPRIAEYGGNGWHLQDESMQEWFAQECTVTHWHVLPEKLK